MNLFTNATPECTNRTEPNLDPAVSPAPTCITSSFHGSAASHAPAARLPPASRPLSPSVSPLRMYAVYAASIAHRSDEALEKI